MIEPRFDFFYEVIQGFKQIPLDAYLLYGVMIFIGILGLISKSFIAYRVYIKEQETLDNFVKRYYPNHDHKEMLEIFHMLKDSTGQDDYYKLKAIADTLRNNLNSKKKSYEEEMASYDHLETKTIDHLPTGISLDELRLNDGEIPDRAGHQNQ